MSENIEDVIAHRTAQTAFPGGDVWAAGAANALERVQSGEIITAEMRALAKLQPCTQYPQIGAVMSTRWTCVLCGISMIHAMPPKLTDHTDGCVWVRARRIVEGGPDE